MNTSLTQSQVGYNYYALHVSQPDVLREIEHLRKLPPAAVVVITNNSVAQQIADGVRDVGTLVIARPDPDDNVHQRIDASEWVDRWAWIVEGRTNMALYADNEPAFTDSAIAWATQVGLACVNRGIKCVLLNLAVGHPEIDDIKRAHTLIELIAANPGKLYLGLHEYEDFTVPLPDGQWYMGRYTKWLDYCDTQGLNYPQIILTEWGADRVKQGKPPGELGLTGAQLHDKYLNAWDRWYKGNAVIAGACLFTRWAWGNPLWDVFTHDKVGGFVAAMEQRPIGNVPPSEPPAPITTSYTVTVPSLRVRKDPRKDALPMGAVGATHGMPVVAVIDDSTAIADGYKWRKIIYDGVQLWVAERTEDGAHVFLSKAPIVTPPNPTALEAIRVAVVRIRDELADYEADMRRALGVFRVQLDRIEIELRGLIAAQEEGAA